MCNMFSALRYVPVFVVLFLVIAETQAVDKEIMSSVVKVFAVKSNPNYHQPWQNYPQAQGTGSGCVIEGNRILTNGHVAGNSTFLMVRRQGDPKKYIAKVIAAGHECDLALLQVDDPDFYKGIQPMQLGELPHLQDTVTVVGYPVGGDNVSITEGVVSRIEPTYYSHSRRFLLAVQIDAAINPGNSGGPVVFDNKLVGIAFQGNRSQENMGYMVPTPVIRHFLEDVKDGQFDGFPDIGIAISKMENPDLRQWAKMKPDQTGILISHVSPFELEKGVFKANDVILEIDGIKIANDATVPFRDDEVVFFGHLVWMKYVGETCKFKLLRDGKEMDVEYKLGRDCTLVAPRVFDVLPEYYVLGGLVFVPLTQNFLDAWGANWQKNAPNSLVACAEDGEVTPEQNEVVVLSSVLADDINVGYQDISFSAVKKLNGKTFCDMEDFIAQLSAIPSGFFELELDNHLKVVLDIRQAREANARILKRYRIESDRYILKNGKEKFPSGNTDPAPGK